MTEVISVRFRGGCKAYFFDPQGVAVQEGDEVVVETAQGAEVGTCVCANHMVEDYAVIQPLRPMLRIVTEEDRKNMERNRRREKEAFVVCEKKIAEHGLDMKLVNVECGFDGNKIIFFFTADGRVDFRELVKDLAAVFHARIELRQIGVRDEAKMLGGLGICGQPFCCKRFLEDFQPVSIKMAKTQNLSLNPTKISGSCGRLMCCLKYEQHAYEDAMTRMPKNDSFVQTPDGPGNISVVNLVKENVTVRLDETPEAPKTYGLDEIIVLRNGKGSRDGIAIPERPERKEPQVEYDLFGMGTMPVQPTMRQFRNAPPLKNRAPEKEAEAPKAAPKPAPKAEPAVEAVVETKPEEPVKAGEKGGSRRNHRGGRGRRSGENKPVAKKEVKAPAAPAAQQQPRPVRFASSMPIADNAAAPEGEGKAASGAQKNPRRNYRPNRRFRSKSGGKNPNGGNKEG